jgi:hypothetical protein
VDDSVKGIDQNEIQTAVDELISTIMLIDFVGQLDATSIPTLEEILRMVEQPTAFNLCQTVCDRISCKLLKSVFDPARLTSLKIEQQKTVDLSSLTRISEANRTLYGSRMPVTLFGDYQQLCTGLALGGKPNYKEVSERHNRGVYYTPASLVDYLVFHTLERAFHELEAEQVQQLRILDPSCGCGALLVAALRYVLKWFENNYNDVEHRQLDPQKCLDLLGSMIFGADIDQQAVVWTRRLLLLTVWDFCIRCGVSRSDIVNISIPSFEKSVTCGDFLGEPSGVCTKVPTAKEGNFHIILGSPPFVRIQQLYKSNPRQIEDYKKRFITAKAGQFDLYMLFIERSIQILTNGGYLSMSLSNTFLRSMSGCILRALIAGTCNVEQIVEFEDNKLYPGATVQISMIMMRKTAGQSSIKYVVIKGRNGLRRKLCRTDRQGDGGPSVCVQHLPPAACLSANWVLRNETESELLSKITSQGTPLGKLPVDISFGATTGADSVFLLKGAERLSSGAVLAESRFLDDLFVFESSILKPILRGRYIRGYVCPQPKTLCIFPYDENGKVIGENVIRSRFPGTYQYLSSCRDKLSSRELKPHLPWYAFTSERIIQVMRSPKLVASAINSGRAFAFDKDKNLLCSRSVVILCPQEDTVNQYFLLAILNSSIFQRWSKSRMPTLGSGWLAYRLNSIREFPVPICSVREDNKIFSEIVSLACSLSEEQLNEEDRSNIITTIDRRVSELYGISTPSSPN